MNTIHAVYWGEDGGALRVVRVVGLDAGGYAVESTVCGGEDRDRLLCILQRENLGTRGFGTAPETLLPGRWDGTRSFTTAAAAMKFSAKEIERLAGRGASSAHGVSQVMLDKLAEDDVFVPPLDAIPATAELGKPRRIWDDDDTAFAGRWRRG